LNDVLTSYELLVRLGNVQSDKQ